MIALTEAERHTLVALGVAESRVHLTGMGRSWRMKAKAPRFRERHRLGEHPLVLFLAQKYAYKGADRLLRAAGTIWQRHPEVRFAFVGPRTSHSRRLFAGVSDARLLELGEVGLQEKTYVLAACDVFCLPSTQESFGGVFTEAWSMGKPVVGCDIPAVREVISDGQDGLVSNPSPTPWARAIRTLLDDPARRQEMVSAGATR